MMEESLLRHLSFAVVRLLSDLLVPPILSEYELLGDPPNWLALRTDRRLGSMTPLADFVRTQTV